MGQSKYKHCSIFLIDRQLQTAPNIACFSLHCRGWFLRVIVVLCNDKSQWQESEAEIFSVWSVDSNWSIILEKVSLPWYLWKMYMCSIKKYGINPDSPTGQRQTLTRTVSNLKDQCSGPKPYLTSLSLIHITGTVWHKSMRSSYVYVYVQKTQPVWIARWYKQLVMCPID